jgi:hypothetical protein
MNVLDFTQLSLGAMAMLVAVLALRVALTAVMTLRRKRSDPPPSDKSHPPRKDPR